MIRRPPRSTLFPTRRSSDLSNPRQHGLEPAADAGERAARASTGVGRDRKSTRLNSSHLGISYAVFCLKKKKKPESNTQTEASAHRERTIRHDQSQMVDYSTR